MTMKIFTISIQIGILYAFYFAGVGIQRALDLSFPGSIIGMLLLFTCLCLRIIPVRIIEMGASFLFKILMLLFVPITVGIMNYPHLLSLQGLLLVVAIMLSTVLSIALIGRVVQTLEHYLSKKDGV